MDQRRHKLIMKKKRPFGIRPAKQEEAGFFYALPREKDAELGCVGHVHIDFGHQGKEFWHSWWRRGPSELVSDEFHADLNQLVNYLREAGPLRSLDAMKEYCEVNGGEISGGWTRCYGYVAGTERYQFYLRCIPVLGDYQAYLTAFDKEVQLTNKLEKMYPTLIGYSASGERELHGIQEVAEFICEEGVHDNLIIETPDGERFLDTFGIYINRIADMEYREKLLEVLVPLKQGLENSTEVKNSMEMEM